MGNFLTSSSIGKKFVMSISGCFLVLFLLFHLAMNATAIFSPEAYNVICAALGANWYAVAGTAVLALGVFVHFIYALILTFQNWKARGGIKRYAVTKKEDSVNWSSKNMFVLGCIIGAFTTYRIMLVSGVIYIGKTMQLVGFVCGLVVIIQIAVFFVLRSRVMRNCA